MECCIVESSDGLYCELCKRPIRRHARRKCVLAVFHAAACPYAPIVTRLTPEGLTGLDRCRAANCDHLRNHGGRMVCNKRGSSCEWLDVWAAWLNGERGCRHWLPVAPPSTESTDQVDADADAGDDR